MVTMIFYMKTGAYFSFTNMNINVDNEQFVWTCMPILFCICMSCGIQVLFVLICNCSLGIMQPEQLIDVADGSSNVREVWKFSAKG